MSYFPNSCRAALCLIFVGILAIGLSSADWGSLRVIVVDHENLSIPGVNVSISSPDMMGVRSAVTNEKGEALFVRLFPAVYEIKASLEGFGEVITKNVRVNIEKENSTRVLMSATPLQESVTVIAVSPPIDMKSTTVAEHVTHEFVESLPVARDYLGYIQLVSGVEMVPNSQGRDTGNDPAGKGGLSYDLGGRYHSRDNLYLLDGVNITDLNTQKAGTRFNNEVIQEEIVITSGVPAEYGGGKGVVANIITKSGGNRLSGSVNVYLQNPSFFWPYKGIAAEDTRLQSYKDNKIDTAATLGGPILKDRIWFFTSLQYRDDSNEFNLSMSASPTGELVDFSEKRLNNFNKLSFRLSGKDYINVAFFLDNYDLAGMRDKNYVKDRQFVRDRDYMAYSGYYQRTFSTNFILDFRYGHYQMIERTMPRYPEIGPFDDLQYPRGTIIPNYIWQKGSYMSAQDDKNQRDTLYLNAEWYLGDLRLKAGAEYHTERDKDDRYIFNGEQRYSLPMHLQGWNLNQLMNAKVFSRSDFQFWLLPQLNSQWDATSQYLDLNGDGSVSEQELGSAIFQQTNTGGYGVNFWRWNQFFRGENTVQAKRFLGFLSSDWNISKHFSLNAGLRLENHNYIDSTGGTILHMDTIALPRLGLSWDVGGWGRQKITLFFGQYSDPMDFEILHFAGDLSGRIYAKQIWLANDWYTYYMDGSKEKRNAYYAPNLKDSYSQEYSITHALDSGGWIFTTQAYLRQDFNIITRYDARVYTQNILGNADWGHLALTAEDIGYSQLPTNTNNFIANMVGGKRKFMGVDFEASKRFLKGSMLVLQYSFKSTRGNSLSDKDFRYSQGAAPMFDPRNEWMYGPLTGTIPHKIKVFGTWKTPLGLNVGALVYWTSGMKFTEGYAPDQNWPLNAEWTEFVQTGQEQTPPWYQADLKFNFPVQLFGRTRLEMFLDVYNVTDNQAAINVEWTHMSRSWQYKQPTRLLNPRRFYLGGRFKF